MTTEKTYPRRKVNQSITLIDNIDFVALKEITDSVTTKAKQYIDEEVFPSNYSVEDVVNGCRPEHYEQYGSDYIKMVFVYTREETDEEYSMRVEYLTRNDKAKHEMYLKLKTEFEGV